MKVKELIKELSTLDPNLNVYTPGYEGGFDDLNYVSKSRMVRDYHKEWYYGSHELLEDVRDSYEVTKSEDCIIVFGDRR